MRAKRTAFLSLVMVTLGAAHASAQSVYDANIDAQQWRPAPGPSNFLTVHGARVDGNPGFSAGGYINYAWRPFSVFNAVCTPPESMTNCTATSLRSEPVRHLGTLNALGSITVARRLQIGLDIPLSFEAGDNVDISTGRPFADSSGTTSSQSRFTVGDPRLDLKVRLAGEGLQGVAVALGAFVQAPLGRVVADQGYLGDASLAVGGRAIVDFRRGRFSFAGNLGGIYRLQPVRLYSTYYGSQLTWGVAGGFDITPRLSAILEGFGTHDLSGEGNTDITVFQQAHVEATVAARYRIGHLSITAGGGTGIVRGFGSPNMRFLVGAVYAPFLADSDRDGIGDEDDRCPTEVEDRDNFEDNDGCPEADNDADGLLDPVDRCPDQAEDRDGFQDTDGCPDNDNDNDGIPDGYDSCPREPEDRDGDRDTDGCPDNDRDRDGIPDDHDRCPTEQEDTDGFQDEDGCPEADNDNDRIPDSADQCGEQPETYNGYQDDDGCPDTMPDRDSDGITDDHDRCPEQAETYNGVDDADGCPEAGPSLVQIQGDRIMIMQQVNFATNSDRIVGRRSFQILDAVASVLTVHPEFANVEIQGHTDNRGDAERNRGLSQRRAEAVKRYLVTKGIAEGRLTGRGFGPDRPIESNANNRGRAANRRVEFHIVPPAAPATPAGGGETPAATPAATPATPAATPATPATPAATPATPATPAAH